MIQYLGGDWGGESKDYSTNKLINIIQHANRTKGRNPRVNLIDTEKAYDKVQHYFPIKDQKKPGIHVKIIKTLCRQQTSRLYPEWRETESVFPKVRTREGWLLAPLLFDIMIKVLTSAVKQEKELEKIERKKKEYPCLQMTGSYC